MGRTANQRRYLSRFSKSETGSHRDYLPRYEWADGQCDVKGHHSHCGRDAGRHEIDHRERGIERDECPDLREKTYA